MSAVFVAMWACFAAAAAAAAYCTARCAWLLHKAVPNDFTHLAEAGRSLGFGFLWLGLMWVALGIAWCAA